MAYLPEFTATVTVITGPNSVPPNTTLFTNIPAAVWFSRGRSKVSSAPNSPVIVGQAALAVTNRSLVQGWSGNPPVFDYSSSLSLRITNVGVPQPAYAIVWGGPMWLGTPQAHWRYDLANYINATATPTTAFPTGRVDGYTTTCDVYRPFGAAAPVIAGLVGVFYSDLQAGRGGYSGGNYSLWTDFLDVASSVDIRDGSSRAGGLDTISYADGDEVRIPSGGAATRYVVMRVVNMRDLTGVLFKRVYLVRDQAHWPGP